MKPRSILISHNIKRQRFGDLGITLISVAIDIGKALPVRVHDLVAAV